jgi:hypothetical protein
VVLIDVQVTLAFELERETTVLGNLLQHMVEKADPGSNTDGAARVQVDAARDAGLFRRSIDERTTCCELAYELGPFAAALGSCVPPRGNTELLRHCAQAIGRTH